MIIKKLKIVLTEGEINSPEPIQIKVEIADGEDSIIYTIDYPKK